jgi:hypothetical protein
MHVTATMRAAILGLRKYSGPQNIWYSMFAMLCQGHDSAPGLDGMLLKQQFLHVSRQASNPGRHRSLDPRETSVTGCPAGPDDSDSQLSHFLILPSERTCQSLL